MERPKFEPILSKKDYIEKTDSKPIETLIPGQAMILSELMRRFESGQRLNVHENFKPGSNFTQDCVYEEDFDDAAPDFIHDVVDVHTFYKEHQQHKSDFKARQKEKKSQQASPKEAPQDVSPTPPDPSKS